MFLEEKKHFIFNRFKIERFQPFVDTVVVCKYSIVIAAKIELKRCLHAVQCTHGIVLRAMRSFTKLTIDILTNNVI